MPVTLNLEIPEHLKVVFETRERLIVRNQLDNVTRDAVLLWLWSREGQKVWVTSTPVLTRARLSYLLQLSPHVNTQNIKFIDWTHLTTEQFEYGVIERHDEQDDISWWAASCITQETRIIEQEVITKVVTNYDLLPLAQRKMMLQLVREGHNQTDDEYAILNSIVCESLYEFLIEFWSTIVPETFIDNWHIRVICEELQRVAERVFADKPKEYDLVINIAPGLTKSLAASVMLPAWIWKRMASARFIGASYAHLLAMDLSRRTKEVVLSPKYQRCSQLHLKQDQQAKSFFMNDQGGVRLGIGTGGIAGFHAHFLCVDDPLDPNKAVSDIELKSCNTWIAETLSQRKVDQQKTPMILIMQRLHQNDPTAKMLERGAKSSKIRHICLPATDNEDVLPAELRAHYIDGYLDPKRLPEEVLVEKRLLGSFLFSGQFMQRPTPPGGAMFKWERILFDTPWPLNDSKWVLIVRYWDKAGTQDDGCRTAGVKMGLDKNGVFWILHSIIGQWECAQRESIIRTTAEIDTIRVRIGMEQEPGSSGKDVAKMSIRNLVGFSAIADRPTGSKELRADPFATQVNAGNVRIAPGSWNIEYLDELQFFPHSTFKDQVDASSGAFKMLIDGRVPIGAFL